MAIEDLAAALRSSQDDAMRAYLANSQAALEPTVTSPNNVMEQAVTSVIPLLAGLFRGREGLAAGAQGSLAGLNVLNNIQKEDVDNKRKLAALSAQSDYDQFKTLRDKMLDIQMLQATEPFKQGLIEQRQINVEGHKRPAQTNITNMAPMDTKASDKITNLEITAEALKDFKSFLEQEFPQELKSGEGLFEVIGRLGKANLAPGSKEMELKSRVDELTSRLTEDLTTGTPSNFDAQRIVNALTGGGLADVKLLGKRIDSYVNRTSSYIDKFQKNQGYYSGKYPFEEIRSPKAPSPLPAEGAPKQIAEGDTTSIRAMIDAAIQSKQPIQVDNPEILAEIKSVLKPNEIIPMMNGNKIGVFQFRDGNLNRIE